MLSGDAFRSYLRRELATYWLHTDVDHDNSSTGQNNVANLRNNAFATSESSDKAAFAFHLSDAFHVLIL